jgi:hypothetical protein
MKSKELKRKEAAARLFNESSKQRIGRVKARKKSLGLSA